MAYQSKLNTAIALQNDGQFLKASSIYLTLLEKKPNSFDPRQLLALCYHQLNRFDESLSEFEKAIKIKTNHAASRNNLGNVYMDIGEYNKAQTQFKKAIEINPKYSIAYNNLGNCLQMLHDYDGAATAYKRAIAPTPKEARFHDNLGVALMKQGRFEDALEVLQQAHNLDPSLSSVYVHLFDLLLIMHLPVEAINLASSSIAEGVLSDIEKYALHIGIAINCWLSFELDPLSFHLESSEGILNQFDNYPNITNLRVFHRYLSKLLEFSQQNKTIYQKKAIVQKEDKIMVMLSESHGFSPSATLVKYQQENYRIKSFLLTGAKMWHLSQTKDNMFNQSVGRFFANLPKNCKIIMGFGEIDCRVNEGIYPNFIKTGNDYHTSIPSLVENYVNAMLNVAKPHGHQIIFYGVPAPHPNMMTQLDEPQRLTFLNMIRLLNQQLIQQCKNSNCPMLDVYSLTVNTTPNQQGQSNLQWHFDDIHLHPETFSTLFAKHLLE